MPMTKKQWLEQIVQCDEWGRPPSLADVPLTYMARATAFEKRRGTKKEINTLYKEYVVKASE